MKILKNKLIKFSVISVFSLIIFFVLVGCNTVPTQNSSTPTIEEKNTPQISITPTKKSQTPTPVDPPDVIQVATEDLEGTSIRFMHPWPGETGELISEIATKFSLSNQWGIWVEVESYGSEESLIEKAVMDIREEKPAALIAAHPYNIIGQEDEYVSVPLMDYVNHPDWGFDASAWEDIPQVYKQSFTIDDQLIALPIAPQAIVLFYNQSWGEALGFESVPVDIDSFTEQVCAATDANLADDIQDNDFTGGLLMNFDPGVLLSWYAAFDGEIGLDGLPEFNNRAGQSAFGYLENLYTQDKNCIWVGRQQDPYLYFANRYTLMYAGTLNQIPLQKGWMEQAINDDVWTVTGFPGPDGEVMLLDSPGLFITESTPETQLAAWLFAKYLLSSEVQAQLVSSLFTLPVRTDSMEYLGEFAVMYPQWAEAQEKIEFAVNMPISGEWGFGRWILQDAINRLFAVEEEDLESILEQLDATILDMGEISP